VFGGLRDEIWRLELAWVVGVEEEARDALLSAPVDVFFEVIVPLPPLSTKEAVALVRHRVGEKSPLNKSEITDLVRLGEGHPRRLVDLVRAVLLDGTTVDGLAERLRSRGSRLQHVSRPAASLAAELEALGPMSPSDTELQERMGVSRPRLVTLFSELRDAGLVREAAPARDGSRPGRPRVRYVLTDSPGRPVGTDASDGSPESSGQCVGGLRDPAEDER
jgi:DNA-binding MarR family transcriptional regulator